MISAEGSSIQHILRLTFCCSALLRMKISYTIPGT